MKSDGQKETKQRDEWIERQIQKYTRQRLTKRCRRGEHSKEDWEGNTIGPRKGQLTETIRAECEYINILGTILLVVFMLFPFPLFL